MIQCRCKKGCSTKRCPCRRSSAKCSNICKCFSCGNEKPSKLEQTIYCNCSNNCDSLRCICRKKFQKCNIYCGCEGKCDIHTDKDVCSRTITFKTCRCRTITNGLLCTHNSCSCTERGFCMKECFCCCDSQKCFLTKMNPSENRISDA
jgi:hypothetical protein